MIGQIGIKLDSPYSIFSCKSAVIVHNGVKSTTLTQQQTFGVPSDAPQGMNCINLQFFGVLGTFCLPPGLVLSGTLPYWALKSPGCYTLRIIEPHAGTFLYSYPYFFL